MVRRHGEGFATSELQEFFVAEWIAMWSEGPGLRCQRIRRAAELEIGFGDSKPLEVRNHGFEACAASSSCAPGLLNNNGFLPPRRCVREVGEAARGRSVRRAR